MTTRTIKTLLLAGSLCVAGAPMLSAQARKHESRRALRAQAKIPMASARKSALALVPGGSVKSSELERENGQLVYSFHIASKGKPGVDEVQIDALTGAQIGSVVHEASKAEHKEAPMKAKEGMAEHKAVTAAAKKPSATKP